MLASLAGVQAANAPISRRTTQKSLSRKILKFLLFHQNVPFGKRQQFFITNAVTLATLHSSKGLEFENVYIIDANEGIMPYKKAVLEKDIEEERRLFYVGMTRAKTSLSVYSVKSVNDKSAQASRFVRESKEPRQNNSRDD